MPEALYWRPVLVAWFITDEQRNMILAVVLSAIVLFGWSFVSEWWFPTANAPPTKIITTMTIAMEPSQMRSVRACLGSAAVSRPWLTRLGATAEHMGV